MATTEPAPSVTATATATPSPSPTATATATAEATATTEPEDEGGDEGGNRIRADFTVDGEGITPPQVQVAEFLGIELRVKNDLQQSVTVIVDGQELVVEAGDRGTLALEGLRAGKSYTVRSEPGGSAEILVGEPGP